MEVRPKGAASKERASRGHGGGLPEQLHHIEIDAHDLPGLVWFWTLGLRWQVLSERDREIVIGPDENAQAGMCFMPVTDGKHWE